MNNNVIELEKYCRQDLERRIKRRNLARFAKSLMYSFKLPPDDSLVLILGKGSERDNLEAMQTWVEINMLPMKGKSPRDTLLDLTRKLHYQLEDALGVSNG